MGQVDVPEFGSAFTASLNQPFLTLGELGDHLLAVTGFSLNDIRSDGLRVTAAPGRADGPVFLEITTYCRDENGKRYLDEARDLAVEVRRFPLASLILNKAL